MKRGEDEGSTITPYVPVINPLAHGRTFSRTGIQLLSILYQQLTNSLLMELVNIHFSITEVNFEAVRHLLTAMKKLML